MALSPSWLPLYVALALARRHQEALQSPVWCLETRGEF
jgi:hypothetical protein